LEVMTCSQCGREAPTEADEFSQWRHGEVARAGELDDVMAGLLLCPACWAEDLEGDFDAGGED
jgi:hypothetical protein